ncbi:MAG: hypothetical protein ABL958_21055, partial [Bdellovibrionia bacterium]
EAIWARFPYLHNGSVPSVIDLLTEPTGRPRVFSLEDSGEAFRFDESSLGLNRPAAGSSDEIALIKQSEAGDRSVYDIKRVGHSSGGHNFGTGLPIEDKLKLIEYLKTL